MKHVLFPVDELAPGSMRAVDVDGIAVVLVRDNKGGLYALRDVCPHRGARLSKGVLKRMVVADDVGDPELTDTLILRCPWHHQEFDISSGRCVADGRQRVRVYATRVEDGTIVLER